MKIKDLIICSLFAALICIFSVISIPIGTVPVTLSTFALCITAVILPPQKAVTATAVYIMLGICGLPVFSGFQSGIGTLAGPTGGYIYAYIPSVLIMSVLVCNINKKRIKSMVHMFFSASVGIAVCYTLGTFHFMLVTKQSFTYSAAVCVLPFIPFDIVKCACAVYIGKAVKRIIKI